MENIILKKVELGEAQQLQEISITTFIQAFGDQNSSDDMAIYVRENLSIAKLTEEIENSQSVFYFAFLNDQIIGYLKLNYGYSDNSSKEVNSVELERIYILELFQGQKIGQQLFDFVKSLAIQLGAHYLKLGVWEKNLRAIKFYKRNGMIIIGSHHFQLGNDLQTDLLMELKLNNSIQ